MKIDSDNNFPITSLGMHNYVILIKSVFNKSHNQYYYKAFLEKC